MRLGEYRRPLIALGLIKGAAFIIALVCLGIVYLVIGNFAGRAIGLGLLVLGVAFGLMMVRSLGRRS